MKAGHLDRVIFLDVDGVLNHPRSPPWQGWDNVYRIDPEPTRLMNALCKRTRAKIVVSSSWRYGPHRGPRSCRGLLRQRGLDFRFHRDWRTVPGYGTRGPQIAAWLGRHPVASYAIVDDEPDMLPEQMDRFVNTDGYVGLLPEHCDRIAEILERPL